MVSSRENQVFHAPMSNNFVSPQFSFNFILIQSAQNAKYADFQKVQEWERIALESNYGQSEHFKITYSSDI